MGNQCCAFKGNKNTVEEAYSRTSIEQMSIEKISEDRVKKSTSSSASEKERRGKGDGEKDIKSEEKMSIDESKEVLDKATNDEKSKEETDRAVGGRDVTTVEATPSIPILYETPKRDSIVEVMESMIEEKENENEKENEDDDEDVETARSNEGNGRTPTLMEKEKEEEITPVVNDEFGEEDDVVGEIPNSSYDMRPIRPLPTPLRKVDITPTRRIEMFCDERGRVRRNEKIMQYLDHKRKSYENNIS